MNQIAFFDLTGVCASALTLALLVAFFRRFPFKDLRWILLLLLLVNIFDHLSNFFEWSGLSKSGWDYVEDFVQISIPMFYLVIFYGFRQLRARRELEASERKLRNIAEQINDVVFTTDTKGILTYVSPSVSRVLGYATEEITGRPFIDLLPAGELPVPASFEHFKRVSSDKEGAGTFVVNLKRKDGEAIIGEINAVVLKHDGKASGTQGVIRDITERRKVEEVLIESEERLRQYIDTAGVVMVALDRQGCVSMINRKGCEVLCCDSENLVGKNWFDNFVPEKEIAEVKAVFAKIMSGEMAQVELYQNRITNRRGESLIMAWRNSILRDRAGRIVGSLSSGEDITERLAADERIRASEEKYRSLVENSTDIIARFDRDLRIIYVNPAVNRISVHSPDEIIGRRIDELDISDRRKQQAEAALKTVFATGRALDTETSLNFGGRQLVHSWRLIPEFADDGAVRSVICVARDITELRTAEMQYAELFDSMLDGFAVHELIYDENGQPVDYRFISVNPAFERLTGLRAADIKGKTALQVIPGLEKVWLDNYFRVVESGEPLHFEQYSEALNRHFEITAYRNAPGQFTAIFTDTTERVLAQDALKKNEEQLRLTIDSIQDMVHVVDCNLSLVLANNTFYSWCRKYGFDVGAVGVKLQDAFPFLTDSVISEYRSVFESGQVLLTEESNKLNNQTIYTETRKVPIVINGKVSQVLTIVRDISDHKLAEEEKIRLQEKLNQALKLEAIGRLAGGVAHDFNNLLTGISGNVELALMDLPDSDPLHEALREINDGAERAAALTRQLLAFGRKQIIEPKALSVNDLLQNLQKMLGRIIGEDIKINWLLKPDLWTAQIDPGQIEQVVVNMVINSRDAMPDGGTITIETENVVLGEDYVNRRPYVAGGDYVMLAISDTGCGMDEATRSRVFEPFFTTKAEGAGSGLGLATSFGIIKQHKGSIEVYSEPGHGSTFKIYLPRVLTESEIRRVEKRHGDMPGGSETILVVEDEEIVRNVALRILSRLGYKLLWAANGPDALKIAEKYMDGIDLLMTDVVMPRMNGRELSERFLKLFPGIKVLFTSGYTENVIAHHGVLDEGVNFIGKPYTPQSLAVRVREVLDA